MSRGKHLSLEEARRTGQLDRFCREHATKADRKRFEALLEAMSLGALEERGTLKRGRAAGSSETRTRQGT